jgi:hypothetical protein
MVGLFRVYFCQFHLGGKVHFCLYTEGADQYIDRANGVIYARQWSAHPDVPQPEMATVRVQVSWRGAMADRTVMVSAVAPQT